MAWDLTRQLLCSVPLLYCLTIVQQVAGSPVDQVSPHEHDDQQDAVTTISPVPAFGQEMREAEFSNLLPGVAFVNHASYGVPPKQVRDEEIALMTEYYSDPDTFVRRSDVNKWSATLDKVAPFFGTTSDRIAMTISTTDGVNMVLWSLTFASGDAILRNRFTYPGVQETIDAVASRTPGVQVISVEHVYPIASSQQVIEEYTVILDANPNVKLAVIDHISSQPAILFPVEPLVALCRSRGIAVLIDGAHAVGQVPINLDTMGATFYAGSLHKWVFGARGSGFLYVDPEYHDVIKPNMATHDYDLPFPDCVRRQGSRNMAPVYASGKAVDFYNEIGGLAAVTAYNTDLLDRMTVMLRDAWNSTMLDIPPDMVPPFIKSVFLPPMTKYSQNATGAIELRDDIRDLYDIWAVFTYFDGSFLLRLSAQIYCVEDDYFRLRDAVLALQ